MTITVAESEDFHNAIKLISKLRSIPLEIIEFYLENEHGYVVKKAESNDEKTVIVRPFSPPAEREG
ncbi:MAG: hypothetical protein RKP20_14890 [Candidatus Competibacter sp.]|nr:hypothetical protein [Candidatus Competibacter sp.]MDS4070837.1 hypothetical protein [Candidatus Competibacter sp.]